MARRGEVRYRLLLDGAKDFEKGFQKAAKSVVDASKVIAGFGAAVGAGLALATKHAIDLGGKLTDLSAKTGASMGFLQKFGHAAKLGGSDMDALARSVNQMQKQLISGSAEAERSFKALGLSSSRLKNQAPEKTFTDITNALKAMKNPTDQAGIAMTIFGRAGAEMLPAIKSGMAEAAAEAERLGFVMSDEAAKAADALGDALDTAKSAAGGFVMQIGSAIVTSESMHLAVEGLTDILGELNKAVAGNQATLRDMVDSGILFVVRGLSLLATSSSGLIMVWTELQVFGNTTIGIFKELGNVITSVANATKHAAAGRFGAAKDVMGHMFTRGSRIGAETDIINEGIRRRGEQQKSVVFGLADSMDALAQKIEQSRGKTRAFGDALGTAGRVGVSAFKQLGQELKFFDDGILGPTLEELGLIQKIGGGLPQARMVTGALTTAMSGTGVGIGPKVGQEDLEPVKAVVEETRKWHEALQDVANAFRVLGIDADSVLGQILGGITAAASALEGMDFSKAGGGFSATGGKGLSGLLGNLTGGLQLFGAARSIISGIGGALGIGGDKEHMQVNDMRDAFFAAQGGFEQLQKSLAGLTNQDLVAKIFNAKTVDDFNRAVAEATGLLDTQAKANAAARDVIERYGLTVEQLGPKWRQQELDTLAGSLLSDFTIMTEGLGVGMSTAIAEMGPAFNEFVQQAIAAGGTIPEALRPALQALVDSGQLLDANGDAFENLEATGLTFAQTTSEALQDLTATLQDLVRVMQGLPPISIPVEADLSGFNASIGSIRGGAIPDIEGIPTRLSSAGGFGSATSTMGGMTLRPKRLASDTLFQAHAGEHVLVAPKKFRVKAISAAGGFGDGPLDQDTGGSDDGIGGGSSGGETGTSGGGGTTSTGTSGGSTSGTGSGVTTQVQEARREIQQTQRQIDQVVELIRQVAERPEQPIAVNYAPNINQTFDPTQAVESRQALQRLANEGVLNGLRDGHPAFMSALKVALDRLGR